MWSSSPTIQAGHLVIIWMTRDAVQPLLITPGKDFNSKYGNYRHTDFLDLPYGSKLRARTGKGFIHVLRPTPELWTMALPHRTQILYLADIAFITTYLDIRRGSRVIEAGTGSGSFSHSIARTIGVPGHLWSYEFHEARANKAREEFDRHGMADIVTLTHRNVCKEGFTVQDTVDAVFLDLPAPWDAVEHAKKALRKDRTTRICCFSPCMEQVLRTVSALNDSGFTDITMYETLLRPHDVSQVPSLVSVEQVAEKIKVLERKREEKRLRQIAMGRAGTGRGAAAPTTATIAAAAAGDPAVAVAVGAMQPAVTEPPSASPSSLVESQSQLQLQATATETVPVVVVAAAATSLIAPGTRTPVAAVAAVAAAATAAGSKRKLDDQQDAAASGALVEPSDKKAKIEWPVVVDDDEDFVITVREEDLDDAMPVDTPPPTASPVPPPAPLTSSRRNNNTRKNDAIESGGGGGSGGDDGYGYGYGAGKITISKPFPEVRGHTSYLTFAILQPMISARPMADSIPVEDRGY